MGCYLNGVRQGKPYINGARYNAYLNGQKIWQASPVPGACPIVDGYVQIVNCESFTGRCNHFVSWISVDLYNASGVYQYNVEMWDSFYVGVPDTWWANIVDCGVE